LTVPADVGGEATATTHGEHTLLMTIPGGWTRRGTDAIVPQNEQGTQDAG
jgi:hypothetical protein